MVAKNDSAIELTYEEFERVINNSHKLVVVDFFAEWCMPCLMISPMVEELAEQMQDVKFVKINIDDNHGLANRYHISNIPCLIIFKHGKEASRIIGVQTPDAIEEKIREHL